MFEIQDGSPKGALPVFVHHQRKRPEGVEMETDHPEGSQQDQGGQPEQRGSLSHPRPPAGRAHQPIPFQMAPPATPPKARMTSQANPVATTWPAGAPKGVSRATSASSRAPIPPAATGSRDASFASGQQNSQAAHGRWRPLAAATQTLTAIRQNWIRILKARGARIRLGLRSNWKASLCFSRNLRSPPEDRDGRNAAAAAAAHSR